MIVAIDILIAYKSLQTINLETRFTWTFASVAIPIARFCIGIHFDVILAVGDNQAYVLTIASSNVLLAVV